MINKNLYKDLTSIQLNDELLNACQKGNLEIVKYILTNPDFVKYILTNPDLKKYSNINDKNNKVRDALICSCIKGHLAIVKYLLTSPDLKEHVNVNDKDNIGGYTNLIYACMYDRLDLVKYLLTSPDLKEHADINQKDNNGMTGLMYACRYSHLDLVKYFIIELNINTDENMMRWLKGENQENIVYENALKIIESKELHNKFQRELPNNKINNKGKKI